MSTVHIVTFILEMLVSSTVIWAATLALKRSARSHLSPRAHLAIWTVLIVRLVLPVTFETGLHVTWPALASDTASAVWTAGRIPADDASWNPPASGRPARSLHTPEARDARAASETARALSETPAPGAAAPSFDAEPADVVVAIWVLGILLGTALSLRGYDRLRRVVRKRLVPGADPLHQLFQECLEEAGIRERVVLAIQNDLAGPALMYPNIVLVPDHMHEIGGEAAKMALRHELTHFRRRDHLKSLGLNILRIIWWFHPVVWLAVRTIREDIETACDADVVRPLGKHGRSMYAQAILSMFGRTETCQAVLGMAFGNTRKNAEKRIRGIFMKKKSTVRGRTTAICLAGLLSICCLTTACQPTPAQEAVVNQRDGVPTDALIGESESADPEATTAPAAQYQAVEKWDETIDKAENFKVIADVDVMEPDVSAYPVEKIAPRELTQELANQLINYFAPGAAFRSTASQRTKADWETLIMGLRDTMAEDEARGDTDAVMQEQLTLEQWTEQYESAPESVEEKPADTTFGYMFDEVDGAPLTENGPNYIEISSTAVDGSVQQFDVRRRDDSDPSQFPYFSYVNVNYQTQSGDEANMASLELSRESVGSLEEPYRSEELDRLAKLDAEVERRSALYAQNPMTEAQATARGAEVLEGLGIYGTQITSCEKALLGPYGDGLTDLLDGTPEDLNEPGMYLVFRRENGGVPCIEPEIQFLNPNEEHSAYCAPFRPESGSMILDADGTVRMFQWESPSQAVEIVSTDSKLIPLNEAKERLIEELYRRELGMSSDFLEDASLVYDIQKMQLVMGYAEIQNEPDNVLAVPAWLMRAQGRAVNGGESVVVSDQEIMISALDGRPILLAGTRS